MTWCITESLIQPVIISLLRVIILLHVEIIMNKHLCTFSYTSAISGELLLNTYLLFSSTILIINTFYFHSPEELVFYQSRHFKYMDKARRFQFFDLFYF
jgi:hypothetical protein